jgi:RNA polymerase sigma-B factor
VAALALVKAVDRFDPARGGSFSSFATPTILGEIKRHFRDTRWAVHVPRDLQERAQRAARESDRLATELRRAPTPSELAEAVGTSVEDVLEALEAFSGYDVASLDAPVSDADADADEPLGEMFGCVDERYERVEQRVAVAPALAGLSRRDRMALRLRFDADMTQAEIGGVLGVSQMQVSRILRRSLSEVRAAVEHGPAAARECPADRHAEATSGLARESACPPRQVA